MRAAELDRFFSHVIKGPLPEDCWFWVGAIGDDGYGRFWISRDGRQRAVRPHRYLYEHVTDREITPGDVLMHDCDVPICVHVDAEPARSHLALGTRASNMRDRSSKGRVANGGSVHRMRGLGRAVLYAHSRALRAQLLERGFDRGAIGAILADIDPDQPTLF
ncbi:hypothetical protein ACIRCZ_18575 [Leifsonia sp. NPDC102414]|uniref:hypothetical protein n=1 Tax=Leifsonia sp. NPDC102414 TaxID=3364124 RepID=UPI0038017A5E